MKRNQLLSITLSLFSGSATTHAVVIAGYDFDDGAGGGTLAATVSDANVTASNFGTGAGLINNINLGNGNNNLSNLDAEGNVFGTANGADFGGARGAFGFADHNNQGTAARLNQALNQGDYMTFTVTPDAGFELGLESFTFRTRVNQLNNSADYWALFSSVDGFMSSADQIASQRTTVINTYGVPGSGDVNNVVVDLSAADFQDLTGPIEFRLAIYGGNASSSSATLFDKVIVNGDVTPIPEPSSLLLLTLGLGGLTIRRR